MALVAHDFPAWWASWIANDLGSRDNFYHRKSSLANGIKPPSSDRDDRRWCDVRGTGTSPPAILLGNGRVDGWRWFFGDRGVITIYLAIAAFFIGIAWFYAL
jgi:hypothetical protein